MPIASERQEPKLTNREVVEAFLGGHEGQSQSLSSAFTPGGLTLFSYAEPIAIRSGDDRLDVELDWRYSRTTSRHRRLLLSMLNDRFDTTLVTREVIRRAAGLDPLAPPRMYF